MDKFFGFINSLVGKKSFRIILGMALLFFLFKDNVKNNMRLLNVEKAKDVLTKVFKNKFKNKIDKLSKSDKSGKKTSVSDVVDEYGGEKTAKEVAVEDESKVVKKQLKPDSEIQKTQENEKKARQITNIFVKLRALEELYMQRNKDKLIDRSRVAKYGDFVYYSMKTVFDVAHEGADYPESHFFLQVAKNDVIGKKLVGKKVGQLVELEYSDFIATLPEQDRKALQENIDNMIKNTNDEYAKKGVKIFNSTKIKYNVRILDFIPKKIVDDLTLNNDASPPSGTDSKAVPAGTATPADGQNKIPKSTPANKNAPKATKGATKGATKEATKEIIEKANP